MLWCVATPCHITHRESILHFKVCPAGACAGGRTLQRANLKKREKKRWKKLELQENWLKWPFNAEQWVKTDVHNYIKTDDEFWGNLPHPGPHPKFFQSQHLQTNILGMPLMSSVFLKSKSSGHVQNENINLSIFCIIHMLQPQLRLVEWQK